VITQRALTHTGERAAQLRVVHGWLREIARRLEPLSDSDAGHAPTGTQVRERVTSYLDEMAGAAGDDAFPTWLRPAVDQMRNVLGRLEAGLYHCYDVPGLPRTNNDLEHFYRQLKAGERRITGHRRSDQFVVRVGGFAAFAISASQLTEGALQERLAGVSATDWQRERETLRATQERQAQMRRFRLHRDAYLANLEAHWTQLSETGPP
jgi:hypothetical protein